MRDLFFARFRNDHKFTHYLFRFPAKFHPPAVRCLISRFSQPGDLLLDPFCGSGTLLVEALTNARQAIGVDVDPVAVFISRVKSRPIPPKHLERAFVQLQREIRTIRRSPSEYDRLIHEDLSPTSIQRLQGRFSIPPIPNIDHWFRTYVTIDLARLRQVLLTTPFPSEIRSFFMACFASIIRNASNADPVPVSGLEVTKHMRELDQRGRRIDPFALFEGKVVKEINSMSELFNYAKSGGARAYRGNAARLLRHVSPRSIDTIITSPPYNTAVDYYRRHTLEMYWLNMVRSQDDRLALIRQYIGRERVRVDNPRLKWQTPSPYLNRLLAHAAKIRPDRERALRHYCSSMDSALKQFAKVLKKDGLAVIVVGNSKWNGRRVRPTKLIEELASDSFDILERLTYRTRNRYMSYSRHNGADIDREYVIALRKRR